MLFVGELEVPADTAATAPATVTMDLAPGRITSIGIFFPYKRGAFVGVRIMEREHQQWPTNLDHWIVGDDETVQWAENHDLEETPFELRLEAYNTDDTFAHTVYVRVAVEELQAVVAAASGGLLGSIGDFLGLGRSGGAG